MNVLIGLVEWFVFYNVLNFSLIYNNYITLDCIYVSNYVLNLSNLVYQLN